MTIDDKIKEKNKQGTTYPLKVDQLVAFAVLADLKAAQRSIVIDTHKIAEKMVTARALKFSLLNRTPVFNTENVALRYWPHCGYESEDIEDYVRYLDAIGLVSYYEDYVAGSEGIDNFKEIVNKLYKERPDIAKIYAELVGSSPEKFFHPEGHGHYV